MSNSPAPTDLDASDAEAGDLFALHYPTLVRCAQRWTGSRELAEDLASETFLRVLNKVRKGTVHPISIRSYLVRSLRNTFVDHLRRDQRQALDLAQTVRLQLASEVDPADAAVASADFALCLRRLPVRYRQVLWLTVVEERSLQQVADIMQLSSGGSAAVLAHRARQAFLKAYLTPPSTTQSMGAAAPAIIDRSAS